MIAPNTLQNTRVLYFLWPWPKHYSSVMYFTLSTKFAGVSARKSMFDIYMSEYEKLVRCVTRGVKQEPIQTEYFNVFSKLEKSTLRWTSKVFLKWRIAMTVRGNTKHSGVELCRFREWNWKYGTSVKLVHQINTSPNFVNMIFNCRVQWRAHSTNITLHAWLYWTTQIHIPDAWHHAACLFLSDTKLMRILPMHYVYDIIAWV